jgi:hypothetical protein
VIEANQAALLKSNVIDAFNTETDIQTVMYLVKDIFMITFRDHICHRNPAIKLVVLKLLEILFDNKLTVALQVLLIISIQVWTAAHRSPSRYRRVDNRDGFDHSLQDIEDQLRPCSTFI